MEELEKSLPVWVGAFWSGKQVKLIEIHKKGEVRSLRSDDGSEGEDRKRLHDKRMKNEKKLEKCVLPCLNSNVSSFYDLNLHIFFLIW